MRIAVLASGKGSNLKSIIEAVKSGQLKIDIELVISDIKDAFCLEIARQNNIKAIYIPEPKYKTILSPETEQKYIHTLKKHNINLIVLAGFMRVLKKGLIETFAGKIINIHPSLLPAFPGLESWKQALDYGTKVAGCTVHFVDSGVDTGPIILQASVPVKGNDTYETLHARIQEQEHKIYPKSIKSISENRIKISGRKVHIHTVET